MNGRVKSVGKEWLKWELAYARCVLGSLRLDSKFPNPAVYSVSAVCCIPIYVPFAA